MYSESDLQAAVEAGAISRQAADALRNHVATMRSAPAVDEEQFRLLTGFNDIFVTIAGIILLVAVGWLGNLVTFSTSGLAVAIVAWFLAEYFTRKRRMALPSIVFLLAFSGGVFSFLLALMTLGFPHAGDKTASALIAVTAALTAGATWAHWRRFMVPITVAVGAASAAAVVISLIFAAVGDIGKGLYGLTLVAGLAIFAYAMWWDMSDRARQTRRSDVAFWLHLAAAPAIAHSLFQLLGVFGGDDMGAGKAVMVLALYVAFGLVALAVDRRALLVSSLAYVLYAMYALFTKAGAVETSAALTALVIGSALLLLSALWHVARRAVVNGLPENVRVRLPYVDREAVVTA